MTVTVVIQPYNWNLFTTYCYKNDPFEQYYHRTFSIESVAIPALGLRGPLVENRSIDSANKAVITSFSASLKDVGKNDPATSTLTVTDPLKQRGLTANPYLRRLCVKSEDEFGDITPSGYMTEEPRTICWLNISKELAATTYSITLTRHSLIRVTIIGLPSHLSIDLAVNGNTVGRVSSGQPSNTA